MSRVFARAWSRGIVVLVLVAISTPALGDELRRRGMMGIQPTPSAEKGVLLAGVLPNMPAEKAGLRANDRIMKVNDHEVTDVQDFLTYMRQFYGGDTVTFTIARDDQSLKKDLTLAPRPKEVSPDYDIIYDHATVKGSKVRTFITRPKGEGKFPALVFLPSPLPQSSEFPPQLAQHPYKQLIDALTRAGIATMRVDRLGVGDSEGTDPIATPYATDVETFKSATKRLGEYDFVDRERVYLLSMGLGSALAPTVAEGLPLKGVITYGSTAVRPWSAGVADMFRRMWELDTVESEEIDKRVKALSEYLAKCAKPGAKPDEVIKEFEILRPIAQSISPSATNMLGMPLHYYQDIANTDLLATWGRVNAPVLSLWGEADIQANRKDAELIAESVNAKHKGRGEFRALENVDHGLNEMEDMEDSYLSGNDGGEYNEVVAKTVIEWIKKKSA